MLGKSQSHKITEWLGLEGTSGDHLVHPILLKQVHLEQAAQDGVHASFEYLQRRRLHNPSGQPVPVLRHPHSKVFPHVQMEVSYIGNILAMSGQATHPPQMLPRWAF